MATPTALTISGLDPGGGAGIAADLRAIGAAGAFGCAVASLLTVQSTTGLVESRAVPSSLLVRQLEEVVRRQRVDAVKIGALGSADNVRAVAAWLARHSRLPAVVDPVMLPTAGAARLLAPRAVHVLRERLLPRATLVTANRAEAEALSGHPVCDVEDARRAALAIVAAGARAALVKGGHFEGRLAVDVLAIGRHVHTLAAPRLALPPLHGGGCVLASLIAARLAVDGSGPFAARLLRAVRWARRVHRRALRGAVDVGGARWVLLPGR